MTELLELDTLIVRAGGVRPFADALGCTPHAVAIWVANGHMPAYRALQAAPIYGLSLDEAIALANGTRIPGRRPKPRNIVEKQASVSGFSTDRTVDGRQGALDLEPVEESAP